MKWVLTMGYDLDQKKNYTYSPIFEDQRNDISYTYNEQEGLRATMQSRAVLRARTILAFAYMRANISFFEHEGLIFYGETQKIQLDEKWMKDDSSEFVYIKGSRTAKHVGYYVVPVNPDAGWPGQAGWACAFIQEGKTAEHMMWLIYKSLHHSLLYLIKRPEIANNIATSRRPYKNSMTDFKQPTTEFTNS